MQHVKSRIEVNKKLPLPKAKDTVTDSCGTSQKKDAEPISSNGTSRTYVGLDCGSLCVGV